MPCTRSWGAEKFLANQEKGLIEVAPLAYMRGRTLDNAYIILDEAQNTTPEQMKMFLTRFGFGSHAVITGDATQKDLSPSSVSGLDVATRVLSRKHIEGIAFCTLDAKDVVRHPLVQKIVKATRIMSKVTLITEVESEDKFSFPHRGDGRSGHRGGPGAGTLPLRRGGLADAGHRRGDPGHEPAVPGHRPGDRRALLSEPDL
jgi:hypothetical protein